MPLPTPTLDDRTFGELVEDARSRIQSICPGWSDLSPSDPGMVLLELFAYLTEAMIYRLNRLPEKAYVAFLRLLGVKIQPPSAATVVLRFRRSHGLERPLEIPRGTRVSVGRAAGGAEAPVFVTASHETMAAGVGELDVTAHHCDLVNAELAGVGTGLPGQWVSIRRPPIVAPMADGLDLVLGVEAASDELGEADRAVQHDGNAYRIWREVDSFANLGAERFVYVADRITGTISFAPAARLQAATPLAEGAARSPAASLEPLAEVPAAGREIRVWYRRGGGDLGNVAANTLTILKDPLPAVQVTNPAPAAGGRSAESLEHAVVRGPIEFHTLERAVTATDFELLAQRPGAVSRAKAFTRARLWVHALPGTVEVLLVPYVAEVQRDASQATRPRLEELQAESARLQTQRTLDERRPLGTACLVGWASYKTVTVNARVVVGREEDIPAVRSRVLDRLHQTICPLPTPRQPGGWPFGRPLRSWDVFNILIAEPGVRYADRVRLLVDAAPERDIVALAADAFQPFTWYAASGDALFRSLDDGDGWELARRFDGERIDAVRSHDAQPGVLAVVTRVPGEGSGSRVYVSRDCGETWGAGATTEFQVNDLAWTQRDGAPLLLLATQVGLYELAPGAGPIQVVVDPATQDLGFFAVAITTDSRGAVRVALAAQSTRGVFLSDQGGRSKTFKYVGLSGKDVHALAMQYDEPRSFLWAGLAVRGFEVGEGCYRVELTETVLPENWTQFEKNWQAGSCHDIAFLGTKVLAASHRTGVLSLDPTVSDAWSAADVTSGLPLQEVGRLLPVRALAVTPTRDAEGHEIPPGKRLVMAGGERGVYRSRDGGAHFELVSSREFTDKITIPETWLFCSGEHEITTVGEDETGRD